MENNVSLETILNAAKRLKGKIVKTPLLRSDYIDKNFNTKLFLKAENLQIGGAFKFRGAMNTIYNYQKKKNKL